jgi:CubicO group peptidase (beta-lactamase class C family)
MTSTLAAILHENKEIDLQKSVTEYDSVLFTNSKLADKNVSLQQLLTHTGGFTSIQHSFKTAYLGYENRQELVEALNFKTLVAPNNAFRYSNTGPIVAGMAIEKSLDTSWQELLSKRVFAPLGMNNTTATVPDSIMPSIVTANDGTAFRRGHFKTDKTMHASGGIASTANDLALWLKANINQDANALGGDHIFAELHRNQVEQDRAYFTYQRIGYTLGWDVAEYNEETLLTRFGTYAGYSVHVSFMPEKKLGVIAFTNQDVAFVLPHVIANYAYNLTLGKENTEEALKTEADRLKKSVEKQLLSAPSVAQLVSSKTFEDDKVKVTWGVLDGVLLKENEGYVAHFGSLSRDVKWQVNDQGKVEVFNGSIVYNLILPSY